MNPITMDQPQSPPLPHALPQVAVVTINYKNPAVTLACVNSVRQSSYPNITIFVVENGSGDDSAKTLARAAEESGFTLIISDVNTGFSGGCNQGIRMALAQHADYIWLLNNDTLIEPDTLDHLLITARETGGLVSSPLYALDSDRQIQTPPKLQTLGLYLSLWTGNYQPVRAFEPDGSTPRIDSLSGASLLIPTDAIRRIGLLDERYFLYFEDVEYVCRARRAGFAIDIAPDARTFHALSASTGGGKNPAVRYYLARNRLLFILQAGSPLQKTSVLLLTIFRLFTRLLKSVFNNSKRRAHHHKAFRIEMLAFVDFITGKLGPTSHQF